MSELLDLKDLIHLIDREMATPESFAEDWSAKGIDPDSVVAAAMLVLRASLDDFRTSCRIVDETDFMLNVCNTFVMGFGLGWQASHEIETRRQAT